jgi:hypothetical protein
MTVTDLTFAARAEGDRHGRERELNFGLARSPD